MEGNKRIPNGKKIPTNKKISNKKRVVVYKQSNQSGIVIEFLIAVVLGLVCYICYDKGILFNNQPTESNNDIIENGQTTQKEESVTFTESQLKKYINYISPDFEQSALVYNASSVNAKSLSSADKIKYIGSKVYSKHTSTSDSQYDIISENDVKNAVEEVYGPNTYERTTFNLGCGDYIFNESDRKYYSKTGCGGSTLTSVSNIITSYKATKSKLEITTTYVFHDGMTNKIYKDYNKSIALDNYYSNGNSKEIEKYLENYIKYNKEKLNTIVYTFESSNGINYYFTGFKNNK